MTDNNNKTSKSMFDGLKAKDIKAFVEANGSDPKQALESLKQISPIILMVLDDFMLKNGKQLVSQAAAESYSEIESFMRTDLPVFAMMFNMLDKSEITKALDDIKAQISSSKSKDIAKMQKDFIANVSEEEHTKLYEMIVDVLPPVLRSFYFSLHGVKDKEGMLDYMRQERAYIANASLDTLNRNAQADRLKIDVDMMYNIVSSLANNISANSAENLAVAFNKHMKPQDIEAVAHAGIDLLREFLRAAANNGDIQLQSMTTLDKFSSALRDVFENIENAVIESGITPEEIKSWAKSVEGALSAKSFKP